MTTNPTTLLTSHLNSQESIEDVNQIIKYDETIQAHICNHIRWMTEIIWFFLRAQHVSHIKGLSAFEPLGVIGIDWETWRCVYCLVNLVGASMDMSKCTALVSRPHCMQSRVSGQIKPLENPIKRLKV